MKKMISVFVLLMAFVASASAGRVITDSIQSKVLGATVKYNVYLPDAFRNAQLRFPSIYLLHGLTDTYSAWDKKGHMQEVCDELMNSGECMPSVIIMPNAGGPDTRNTWNGYFNMPGWNYEDFFYNEFLPAVEEKYHCIGDRGHRAVMGLSMGGGGSVVYAQRHPDMFSSCYAMSAWLESSQPRQVSDDKKDCMYYVTEAVWKHSANRFVREADDAQREKLRSVKWFVDCGDDDFLLDVNVDFYKAMREARIKCEFRVRDGVHNWEYWHQALRMSLPFASRNFDK